MNNVIEHGLHEMFDSIKEEKEGSDIVQSGVLSMHIINKLFNFIKIHMIILEKQLKINPDSVIKINLDQLG